ncbi:MAG: phosphodiesterase [Candidatus Wallacebacter cryptica]|jgi:putative phosphoesterase|nr:phosphodiesterase [Bacillota bacterium]
MKIGVISDTHGSLTAWQQALAGPFADVDFIIHTGDVLYHGARNPLPEGYAPADLAEAINACKLPIMIVKGNCDSEVDQMVLNVPLQSPFLITDQPVGRILATHGHYYDEAQTLVLAERYQIEIWISGHTHVPVLERTGNTIFLNPGSCSLPKGEEPRSCVAVITADELQLIDLNTKSVYKSLQR